MVNYRRVLCEVALLGALAVLVNSAPVSEDPQVYYDQRQNGTENLRVNVDGVVFAVVPAEPLIAALGDVEDLMELLSFEDFGGQIKPQSPPVQSPVGLIGEKPQEKPEEKPQEKPEEKPQGKPQEQPTNENLPELKPEEVKLEEAKPIQSSLSDVDLSNELNSQKKEISHKKQVKGSRLKNRLASFLLPLMKAYHP